MTKIVPLPQQKKLGFLRRTFFNPTQWMDYPAVKKMTVGMWRAVKQVYVTRVPQAARQETFAEAMQRLGVRESDLAAITRRYLLLALLFCGVGIGLIILGLHFMVAHCFADSVIAFSIASCTLAQAFKFHFLRFQIIKRKLGCTFQEWRIGLTS